MHTNNFHDQLHFFTFSTTSKSNEIALKFTANTVVVNSRTFWFW